MWTFVLCELDTVALAGAPLGRIENAYDRKVTLGINGLGLAEFKIRLDNPRAKEITDREADVMLKVYQDSTLKFFGECVSAEEVWDDSGPTLACNFVGLLWRLSKRLCAKSATGEETTLASTTRGHHLSALLTATNAEKDTGIRVGTIDPLFAATAGPWKFKPISEVFTEMATSFAPPEYETLSATYQAADTFSSATTVVLNGHGADIAGGAWDTDDNVVGTDFGIDPALDFTGRNSGLDDASHLLGRYAVIGPSLTDTVVQVETARDGTLGTPTTLQGVLARYTDPNNWVRFVVATAEEGSQYVSVGKRLAGTYSVVWQSPLGTALTIGPYATMRLVIDATGRWAVWYFPTGSTPIYIMGGYDADLATGTLSSGKVGMYDYNSGAGTPQRGYENFYADIPTGALDSQALDFELVPTGPTVDGTGVQIATLNVAERLGTNRPDVIFEQGDGTRTMKAYKRAISKDALMTRGYILPSDATPWPTGALITRENAAAILARGLFEDVVSTDAGGAEGAILDLHLNFRKQARQVITFDPSATARYIYGTDYEAGDSVTGRGKFAGQERFNGLFRIYKVEILSDDEGKETVIPTLVVE